MSHESTERRCTWPPGVTLPRHRLPCASLGWPDAPSSDLTDTGHPSQDAKLCYCGGWTHAWTRKNTRSHMHACTQAATHVPRTLASLQACARTDLHPSGHAYIGCVSTGVSEVRHSSVHGCPSEGESPKDWCEVRTV
eukprot:350441-Chlamydomonas_euryale.AAC.5